MSDKLAFATQFSGGNGKWPSSKNNTFNVIYFGIIVKECNFFTILKVIEVVPIKNDVIQYKLPMTGQYIF